MLAAAPDLFADTFLHSLPQCSAFASYIYVSDPLHTHFLLIIFTKDPRERLGTRAGPSLAICKLEFSFPVTFDIIGKRQRKVANGRSLYPFQGIESCLDKSSLIWEAKKLQRRGEGVWNAFVV